MKLTNYGKFYLSNAAIITVGIIITALAASIELALIIWTIDEILEVSVIVKKYGWDSFLSGDWLFEKTKTKKINQA